MVRRKIRKFVKGGAKIRLHSRLGSDINLHPSSLPNLLFGLIYLLLLPRQMLVQIQLSNAGLIGFRIILLDGSAQPRSGTSSTRFQTPPSNVHCDNVVIDWVPQHDCRFFTVSTALQRIPDHQTLECMGRSKSPFGGSHSGGRKSACVPSTRYPGGSVSHLPLAEQSRDDGNVSDAVGAEYGARMPSPERVNWIQACERGSRSMAMFLVAEL